MKVRKRKNCNYPNPREQRTNWNKTVGKFPYKTWPQSKSLDERRFDSDRPHKRFVRIADTIIQEQNFYVVVKSVIVKLVKLII